MLEINVNWRGCWHRKVFSLALACIGFALLLPSYALAVDKVTTYKDDGGWKLIVNDEDFYVKGIVWSYTPRNQNYTYNLWGESDEHIKKVLDYDFSLLKAAGVNSNRSFAMFPPKWVTYVYETYGIMTVINPLVGRYGATVGGKWIPNTDYSDELTRATLKKESLDVIARYKDVPGILMFALGNENNYGLSWSSFEIENLPEGERQAAKAKYLYSLYNEIIEAGKKMDVNHPFSIVNGDIQYIDLIVKHTPALDVLGSNVYRGKSFTNLWSEVDKKLDLPVVFYEFGSDAYNARELREDQVAQALILKDQWQEMYNKAHGNGEEGNSIGGYVFEWRDEWWKYKQTENLDVQDNNASWANGGYPFDFVPGQNNMNEEWFGIAALGTPNRDGVYTARVRMAYDVLTEIWKIDPYRYKKAAINNSFKTMNVDYFALKSEVRRLSSEQEEDKKVIQLTGGRLLAELVTKGREQDLAERGDSGDEFSDGQMLFLDFGFQPTNKISGQASLNILANVADLEPLEIAYGRRGFPVTVVTEDQNEREVTVLTTQTFTDRERVEIYDFDATYEGKNFDFTAFYHVPRYHWIYDDGDFFGLMREATDLDGMDIWNSKAPEGVELAGKGAFEGLKIVAGPEVYWGANPKIMVKYGNSLWGTDYTVILAEDLARQGESSSATEATLRETRQATLYTKTQLTPKVTLELGGLISATEREGEEYDRLVGSDIVVDKIDFEDTLGLRTKLSFPLLGGLAYVGTYHAGLVADGGSVLREFGTRLPYSDLGNKEEYEAGLMMNFGSWMLFPRVLYRDNLVHANPTRLSSIVDGDLNPGLLPRNRDDDPFAVLGNREARAAEIFLTYDPTGATPFYDWDNDWREDAKFAFNVGANYTEYPTFTDSNQFFFEPAGINASFGQGLPAEDVWEVSSRMVFNPNRNLRFRTNLMRGFQQSTGDPNGGSRKFWVFDAKAYIADRHIISGYVKQNAFGPYDFHRQFNITYPQQYSIDYSILLDQKVDELTSTQIGVRAQYRTLDENSPADEFDEGRNDYLYQTVFYVDYSF